jgi:hypothetical protein
MKLQINLDLLYKDGKLGAISGQLIEHLKELRRRTLDGDIEALQDFFELYEFEGPDEEDRKPYHLDVPVGSLHAFLDGDAYILLLKDVTGRTIGEVEYEEEVHGKLTEKVLNRLGVVIDKEPD